MKHLRKPAALLLCLAMITALAACSGGSSANKKYVVGILQLIQHEALDAATKGFQDVLTEKLGDKVTFDLQNAQGDSNTCATIANGFVSAKVNLILANATPALQACSAATATIPILGTSITEYGVALGIKDFSGTVGGNVSGTCDLAPLDQQAEILKELFPDKKKCGLIYCSAEANSQYQVDVVKASLEKLGYAAELYPFSDSNDLAAITTSAIDSCDVLYVPTDNTVASNTGIINNICLPAGVPVITGEQGICEGCGVATLSIDYYDLGRKTGEMAYSVLTGESDISKLPVAYAPNFVKMYNPETCASFGITPPEDYKPIEN
jgi:putative ABC transport system substrate-binding protein